MKVEFEPAAENEFLRAVRWYAMEAGIETAIAFNDEVQRTLAFLVNNATRKALRLMDCGNFPYDDFLTCCIFGSKKICYGSLQSLITAECPTIGQTGCKQLTR